MKHTWKKAAAFVLATALVAGISPANVGTGGLFGGRSIVAHATSNISGNKIYISDNDSGTLSSDMTCTELGLLDHATLTINKGITLTLNINDDGDFNLMDNSKIELHGELAGSVSYEYYTWGRNSYINVYLSDGAKYTVTGLSFGEEDNYLRYYGYDAATDGNGTVGVKNGDTAVTSESIGYKTTTYTYTATPASGYKFKNWTKGAGGEVIGTDASIDVTCAQNGQYQVYANFEEDVATPTIFGPSVTLGDDLALNIYVDGIANATEAAEYTMNFTGACVDSSSALSYNEKEGKYYATTHVYAKDIDKDITATLCKGSDTVDTLEGYSIAQYLSSPAFSEADEKTAALITATRNFGYASAEYFYDDDYGVTATFENYNPDVSGYATTFGSEDALLSLVLDSKTAARMYVKGDTTGTDSTINATKAEYPTYHEITELLPQNLADEQTITVGDTDYTFSALSWCYRVLNSTSASQKNINMAKVIIAYYTAAKNYAPVAVSSVTLDQPTLTLTAEGDTATLTATVLPDNATDKTVTWSSDNEAVATVVDGVVTPVAKGTATITATAGGKSDTCVVTVNPIMYNVSLNNGGGSGTMAGSTIEKGTEYTLPANGFTAPDGLQFAGWKVDDATTVTAVGANITINADTTITAVWVTYTSLSVGTVLHTGDTVYTGGTVAFQTSPLMSFTASNGVITVVEDEGYYKFKRGSNDLPFSAKYKVNDNTDGVYITGGSGTGRDRFTLAVHTTN